MPDTSLPPTTEFTGTFATLGRHARWARAANCVALCAVAACWICWQWPAWAAVPVLVLLMTNAACQHLILRAYRRAAATHRGGQP